jgi:hypothetical protein
MLSWILGWRARGDAILGFLEEWTHNHSLRHHVWKVQAVRLFDCGPWRKELLSVLLRVFVEKNTGGALASRGFFSVPDIHIPRAFCSAGTVILRIPGVSDRAF